MPEGPRQKKPDEDGAGPTVTADAVAPDIHPSAHPSLSSAGNAALGAAGEAVAFFAGAPIMGAADAAIEIGEVVAERETKLEEAITGRHVPAPEISGSPAAKPLWLWLLLGGIFVAAMIWMFISH